MIFNTFAYFFFFLIPASLLFRLLPVGVRPWVIVISGGAFFVYFSLSAVGGVLGAWCLLLFLWESLTSRLYRPGSRWCWLGIWQALLILFAFKYWNFTCSLLADSQSSWRWSDAFLPLGISFFTFEFIHYARDRHQGRTEAGSLAEYLAFILFFPTMVAGPIKRFQDFLPAIRNPTDQWPVDLERGTTRILCGLVKKFAIADLLTSMTVHLNGADIASAERWVLPLWLLAYGFQIYLDFSAYSDIAIGSARLFGIQVKENFDWPYLQTNISAFWRHWHISLGQWLTDYVFIPLGGSRGSQISVCSNLLVTMMVSGIWHGAGLNFIVWGLWHGLALVIHRLWLAHSPWKMSSTKAGRFAAWLVTMITVFAGWAFFVMDVPTSLLFFRKLLLG